MTRISLDLAETPDGQETLREADIIDAVNDSKNFHESLWGEHLMAAFRAPHAPPYQIKQVEITVDSSQPGDIQRAKAAVKKVKPAVPLGCPGGHPAQRSQC
jgi:hypothetical protein